MVNGSKRTRAGISGSGGYIFRRAPPEGYFPGLGRNIGRAAGAAASSYLGVPNAGFFSSTDKLANIGGWLGDKFGKWSGMGKYSYRDIRSGSSYASRYRKRPTYNGRPQSRALTLYKRPSQVVTRRTRAGYSVRPATASFSVSGDGVRIRHREYIGDIGANGAVVGNQTSFNIEQSISLNPGLESAFPWLAGIAASFTSYKWNGLIFQYVTTSGNAISGTNAALGDVMLATNYNVGQGNFTNKQQMLNEDFAISTVPSRSCTHAVEVSPKKTTVSKFWVRTGPVPANQDAKSYDLGTFNLATNGCQAPSQLGELWVSYDVTFYKPSMIQSNPASLTQSAHFSASGAATAAFAAATPLNGMVSKFNNIGVSLVNGNVLSFPPGSQGRWALTFTVYGTTAATVTSPAVNYSNCSTTNLLGNAQDFYYSNNGQTSTKLWLTVYIVIPSSTTTATATWQNNGVYPTALSYYDLIVTQLNNQIA